MYQCKQCDKEFETKEKLGGHLAGMIRSGKHTRENKELTLQFEIINDKYKCPYCPNLYSKHGINIHIWRAHGEGVNHDSNIKHKNKSITIWNKGLSKKTDKRINKIAETYSKNFKDGKIPSKKGSKLSPEIILKLKQNAGGYRIGTSRGKHGWYKGYWCDSSWELAYVIYNLDHEIKFERNKKYFNYFFNGQIRKYYPDFILENGTYVEIKGYENVQSELKLKTLENEKNILIKKDEIKPYLEYVITKYGENFIKLYEKNKRCIVQSGRISL